jgi:hypothetical protein
MQFKSLMIEDYRMTRIGASLIAHYHIGGTAEEVSNFSLSLIAPLRSNNNYISQALCINTDNFDSL